MCRRLPEEALPRQQALPLGSIFNQGQEITLPQPEAMAWGVQARIKISQGNTGFLIPSL